jgi:AcrR family transcriptional regulator
MAPPRSPRLAKKPPEQYHHGDLRRALLQAAVKTLQKQGFQALTLRAVGDELGVSRTALYRHFADKSALLTAVAAEGFRILRLELVDAWERSGRGLSGFEAMGAAYVRFALAHPWHYRVMFGSGFQLNPADVELGVEGPAAFQVLVDALVELQQQALVRGDAADLQARFVWSVVHGIAMLGIDGSLEHQGASVEELTRYSIQRLQTGIGVTD